MAMFSQDEARQGAILTRENEKSPRPRPGLGLGLGPKLESNRHQKKSLFSDFAVVTRHKRTGSNGRGATRSIRK